jgi:hypothetical protein
MRLLAALVGVVGVVALGACSRREREHDGWQTRPLERATGRVGEVAYSIAIPHGLTARPGTLPDIIEYATGTRADRDALAPVVMIGFDPLPPTTLDAAVANAAPVAGDEVTRREAIAGGYIVTLRSPHHVAARVTRTSGTRGVDCMATQADVDAAAWLEQICLSLTIEQ